MNPLAQTVRNNTAIGMNGRWNDPVNPAPGGIATSCHFATLYWAFLAEFTRHPTLNEILKIGNAEVVMTDLVQHGTRKRRPTGGNLALTPGAVLVFVEQKQARHSCVALDGQNVGGYNQASWYSAGGGDHTYSTHPTSQLQWGTGGNQDRVRRTLGAMWYELYEVPETWVKATVRSKVQG